MPIVFINCSVCDFITRIMQKRKLFETRTRNTLKSLIGKRVYLCDTGKNGKIVRCIVTIESVIIVNNKADWKRYKKLCCIPKNSKYDYIPGTKKYLYKLTNIEKFDPFTPIEGKRHGYTWMEYNGRKEN